MKFKAAGSEMNNPRYEMILSLLQNLRQLSVSELTERLGVSQVTIRKDLTQLEELGLIIRSHGSARLAQNMNSLPPVTNRRSRQQDEKQRIARRAGELIREGDGVCIDAGSTTLLLAEQLSGMPIRIVTNSIEILNCFSENDLVTLTALGGNYRRDGGSFIGPITQETVKSMRFDIAFIGATGFTSDGEFMTQNSIEGSAKKAMLEAARRRVIIADSSKYNARGFAVFANSRLVDVLITDEGFTEAEKFREIGIEVLCV